MRRSPYGLNLVIKDKHPNELRTQDRLVYLTSKALLSAGVGVPGLEQPSLPSITILPTPSLVVAGRT
jgi:hypothetical protein